ncbi:DUF4279 domain-containing protein [Massilia endophytica]|uniref:DUF4279 domain-containing protein n=1 Tax=Massilia endophytica TaxID=2899220 RepID=UPI0038991223
MIANSKPKQGQDDDFPTCEQTYAVLRIFSDSIDPGAITELLGIQASSCFEKGESQDGRGTKRRAHGWFLSSEDAVDSRDTRRHVDWIVSRIGEKSVQLAQLQLGGAEIDISCLWLSKGQGGPILSPPQIRELARLNVDIWWDVYFSNESS